MREHGSRWSFALVFAPVAAAFAVAAVSGTAGSWALLAATAYAFVCVAAYAGQPGRRFWVVCLMTLVAAVGYGRIQVGDNVRDVGQLVHAAARHLSHS